MQIEVQLALVVVLEMKKEMHREGTFSNAFPALHPVLRLVNEPGIAEANDIRNNTNAASIVCVIIWNNGDTAFQTAAHISHYLAGDAYWRQEQAIVDWIGNQTRDIGAVKVSQMLSMAKNNG